MFFDWNQTDLKIVQLLQLPVTAPHHAQVLNNMFSSRQVVPNGVQIGNQCNQVLVKRDPR